MPRGGGGGFRGGGFSGGGFSGGGFSGGFRGSSFRGSSGSFRVGSIRSSGRPFGRTGAIRTVSHPSSGPYRHTYYRPRSHYWGWYGNYYRPWYWRWWHYPRFWGYYYRPWYYSPVYIGGGLILLIVLPLILLPLFGVAFYFPRIGGGISSDGTVNYRSTETLGFNEYWYEYEDMPNGADIQYVFSSSPGTISWAISDQSFEELPTTTRYGRFDEITSVAGNEGYEYVMLFLRPGSKIWWNFTTAAPIDFFVANAQNMIEWNNYGSPSFITYETGVTSSNSSANIYSAQDYYVVWYNDGASPITVDFVVDYDETGVTDLTQADYYGINVDYAQGTAQTTSEGRWYFIVYFDPMHSPEESQDITFDVTFETGKDGNLAAWEGARGWLIFFGVVAAILIVMTVVNRRKQKEFKTTASDTPKTQTLSQTVAVQQPTVTTIECPRCGSPMKSTDIYCNSCGEKREGRRVGTETTTSRQAVCEYCGAKLLGNAKFCTSCGSRIK